jgi:16S rRNA U516 pseudouridylate synthase RsuA-like enzyme
MNFTKSGGDRPSEGERLSKRIMQLRDCSRREAEQYIEAGFVRVDGKAWRWTRTPVCSTFYRSR